MSVTLCDPPVCTGYFFYDPPFSRAQKVVTLPHFTPPPPPANYSDRIHLFALCSLLAFCSLFMYPLPYLKKDDVLLA